ncbi:MAG: hypothetical protein NT115_11080 [Proteobacteria bacterium]|nr:hypothetical protein [Pseudomonadota bacterium]
MNPILRNAIAAGLAAMTLMQPAQAVLQRVGPVDPATGYPAWYQDANGMALELCAPTTQADLLTGICFLTPVEVPVLPEVMPTQWSQEHFYYYTSVVMNVASATPGVTTPLKVLMGLEASFTTATPQAGQQVTFARWRVMAPQAQAGMACPGNFTVYSPHRAPKTIPLAAGARLFDTEDIGIGPDFNGALNGAVGPFAMRAATPGGIAAPFATGADGKKYLSAGDLGPITGSGLANPFYNGATVPAFAIPPEIRAMPKTNYFLVSGPGIASGNCATQEAVWSINDIAVIGRVNTTAIASRTNIDRATYRAVDSNADGTPDRFQIGAWANAVQEVNRPEPLVGLSLNKGDPADLVNSTPEVAMLKTPVVNTAPVVAGQVPTPKFNFFNGVIQPTVAGQPGPAYGYARVRTTTDVPATVVNVPLTDELRITSANYNATTKVLTVSADSGAFLSSPTPTTQTATVGCSTPCLTLDTYGLPAATALGVAQDFKLKVATTSKFALGTVTLANVQVPPAFVTVRSSAGGIDSAQTMYLGAAAGTASFQPDTASIPMNVPAFVDVLANDIGVAAVPNLQVCTTGPTGGTCGVPSATVACTAGVASTSCTAQGGRLLINGNVITYSPPANRGGISDTFWYQAATVLGTTQRQLVTVNIGLLNGLPDARDDLGNTGVANLPLTIDVLANDFAPAGVDLATLRIVTNGDPFDTVTGAKAVGSAVFAGGKMVFTAPYAGNWNMFYTFNDRAGIVADQGVVAVTAIGAEVITPRAVWKAGKAPALGTVSVNGTVNIAQGQTLQLFSSTSAVAGCNAPTATAGALNLGTTGVVAGGAFDFGAIPLAVKPLSVWVYSPAFGGCSQITVP